jgi:hypothetical protein
VHIDASAYTRATADSKCYRGRPTSSLQVMNDPSASGCMQNTARESGVRAASARHTIIYAEHVDHYVRTDLRIVFVELTLTVPKTIMNYFLAEASNTRIARGRVLSVS